MSFAKIKDGLKQVLKDIENKFDEINFVDEPEISYEEIDLEPEINDSNPYAEGPWRGTNWYCIRCGSLLKEIDASDKTWGYSWKTMRQDGTQWYQCVNGQCFHHSAPLILHHPVRGYKSPAGDSYSISWVK